MARSIDRDEVRRLMEQGAQIVDVLPAPEYAEDHLPGAVNLPLRKIEAEALRVLDPSRALLVYCPGLGGALNRRASCRLETLGFTEVYDYWTGILDWKTAGLP